MGKRSGRVGSFQVGALGGSSGRAEVGKRVGGVVGGGKGYLLMPEKKFWRIIEGKSQNLSYLLCSVSATLKKLAPNTHVANTACLGVGRGLVDNGEEVLADHRGEEEEHEEDRLVVQRHVVLHCQPRQHNTVSS